MKGEYWQGLVLELLKSWDIFARPRGSPLRLHHAQHPAPEAALAAHREVQDFR